MTKLIIFVFLVSMGCKFHESPLKIFQSDERYYWHPTSEGTVGGLVTTTYVNPDDRYYMLEYLSIDMDSLKDSIIANTKDIIEIEYIHGNYVKFHQLRSGASEDFEIRMADFAVKIGKAKSGMSMEEIAPIHNENIQRSLDKINGN